MAYGHTLGSHNRDVQLDTRSFTIRRQEYNLQLYVSETRSLSFVHSYIEFSLGQSITSQEWQVLNFFY